MPRRFTLGDFLVVFGAGLVANFVAVVLLVAGTGAEEIPVNVLYLVVAPAQLVASLLALIWVRARRSFPSLAEAYGLTAHTADLKYLGLGAGLNVGLTLALQPIALALGIEESPQDVLRIIEELQGMFVILGAGLLTAVLVPVVEELTYRGLLLRLVAQRGGEWTAIGVSSVVFALIHLLGLTSFDRDTVIAFLAIPFPAFLVLGVVFGRLTIRHGRLGPAIFAHAGFDLLTFVVLVTAPGLLDRM